MKTSIPKLHSIKLKNQDNVVAFNGMTLKDFDPQRVLMGAINENLSGVVMAGYTDDGRYYFASSYADRGTAVWLLEQFKKSLLEDI